MDLTFRCSDNPLAKTLRKRAKGPALDIRFAYLDRVETLVLVSPHAQQFTTIDFINNYWSNGPGLSEAVYISVPLLNTFKIDVYAKLRNDKPSLAPSSAVRSA